jgi:cobalt-zinc-cadmium efflux system membrane fusion protein
MVSFRRYSGYIALLIGILLSALPAMGQEEGEAGHMHGPDGRHIAVAGTFGASAGKSILSHHDLMITDTRKPGKEGTGEVVLGCDVHSVVYKKDDRQKAVHKEHNSFEPENGVYGSHMMYKEPGEYVIVEKVTFPDGTKTTLEFPIWVPAPNGAVHQERGKSPLWYVVGGVGGLLLIGGAFLVGKHSGRRGVATLTVLTLLTSLLPFPSAQAQEEGEAGHMHGPDGRHIAVAGTFSQGAVPLKAYPSSDLKDFTLKTEGNYRFRLSIENEELKSDPDVVTLSPESVKALGVMAVAAEESGAAGGLTTTGKVVPNPNRAVTVNARVGGRIVRIGVTPGENVPSGHIVAILDSPEVAQAQAAFVRAQAEREQAQAALNRAKTQTQEAQAELERLIIDAKNAQGRANNLKKTLTRQQDLAASGAFAQKPVEEARSTLATAEGEERTAKAALANLHAQSRRLEEGAKASVVSRKELEAAQTAALEGQTRMTTAEKQVEIARNALAREERILRQGLRNAREVQQAEADVEAALLATGSAEALVTTQRRTLQAARNRVSEEEAGVAKAQSAITVALNQMTLLGAKPGGGSQITITAPLGGEVETRPVNFGEVVTAGQTLATLLDTNTVWVESDVFEKDLNRVRLGQRVTIAADARPGKLFSGTISYIGGEVNPESRAVRVRTVVRNPGELLKPNMFVRVAMAAGDGASSVLIPTEAVQEEGTQQIIFLEESVGTYRRRVIEIGETLGSRVLIPKGLLSGEKVVTKGAYQLLTKIKAGQ